MHRDVIEPASPAIPSGERRPDDARAILGQDDESRVPSRELRERAVVVAGPDADAAREPERTHAIAVRLQKIAHIHAAHTATYACGPVGRRDLQRRDLQARW